MTVTSAAGPGPGADHRPVTAADIMSSPVVTLPAGGTVASAWERLFGLRLHHLVVTDGAGHVTGVLDDRRVAVEWPLGPLGPHRRRVRELVGSRVHCVLPDTPAEVVAQVMTREGLDATPVVLADGQLVGIVTAGDIVALVARGGFRTGEA